MATHARHIVLLVDLRSVIVILDPGKLKGPNHDRDSEGESLPQ